MSGAIALRVAALMALLLVGCGPAAPPRPRTVVLISIDTLRPHRLGVYGHDGGTSPRLDALARQAVVFEQVLSTAPWTLPAHMSMLTGLDPFAHGVTSGDSVLPAAVTTLAEVLSAAGFATGAFTDGGYVSARYGFDQGFELFDDERNVEVPNGFSRMLPDIGAWLEAQAGDAFLFIHTFDVHAPYQEGDPDVVAHFRRRPVAPRADDHRLFAARYVLQQGQIMVDRYARLGQLLNDYDAGVFEADRGVGAVLDLLTASGREAEALVIVTSDHGEAFLERGLHVGHGLALTDDELAVPLLIRFPGGEHGGQRIGDLVDLLDLAPTVTDVLGLDPADDWQGESLARLAAGEPRRRDYVLGGTSRTGAAVLVRDGFKYISPPTLDVLDVARVELNVVTPPDPAAPPGRTYSVGPAGHPTELAYDTEGDPLGMRERLPAWPQLYARGSDPAEHDDLVATQPERAERMAAFLEAAAGRSSRLGEQLLADRAVADPTKEETQAETAAETAREELAELGYVEARLSTGDGAAPEGLPVDVGGLPDLAAIDRDVHELRLRLVAGRRPPDLLAALDQAAGRYAAWATAGTGRAPKVGWRLWELARLARGAGVAFDPTPWLPTGR